MNTVPLRTFDIISAEYRQEQIRLHQEPRGYGGKGAKWADCVVAVKRWCDAGSILDFGCGQGSLGKALRERGMVISEFDPAVPGKDNLKPAFFDLVVCTDVLEHVEPDKLSGVLQCIGLMARKAILVVIALDETAKTLSDGRQAHINLHPPEWWAAKLDEHHWERVELDLPIPLSPEKRVKRFIGVYRPPC